MHAVDRVLNLWLFHEMRWRGGAHAARANGATFLELSRGRFKSVMIKTASEMTMVSFVEQVEPRQDFARSVVREDQTLAELRDTLLPAVTSGQVRVKDAEKQVEEAV